VIVVDTNVVAGLWLPTSTSSASERLLVRDPEWAAPLLWRSEFRSVLAGYLRRGALDVLDAARIAEDAERHLGGREYQVATHEVLQRVAASRCSAYDCEFVALAEELGVLLVTRDRQVLAAFPRVARRPEAFLAS
jgi:predicted nucleic acid-binding protein